MSMYYSKSTGGFYSNEIHSIMPSDIIEISGEKYIQLMDDQNKGKLISSDEKGNPISINRPEIPIETLISRNIQALWKAANDYELSFIGGSATKYLNNNLEKSKAVSNWIDSIWNLYYIRKTLITIKRDESLFDFSSCGPIPYSIPELKAESIIGLKA